MIASAIPEDVHMEVKTIPISWISENNRLSLPSLPSPTAEDVIGMYSQAPLSDRVDCVPYESSDQKFAFFRYLATTKSSLLSSHMETHDPFSSHTKSHRRGTSDFNDTSATQKLQRRFHAIYADSILGIAFLEPDKSQTASADSFQLTLFLFPGDRVIGSEKGLVLNSDLEVKMNKLLLQRMRFLQSNEKNTILRKMKNDIRRSGQLAMKLIATQRAWAALYHPTHLTSLISGAAAATAVDIIHTHLLEALKFHSKVISLQFLNFILPALMKLIVRIEYQHLFIGILQRVFQQQFLYFLVTEHEKEDDGEKDKGKEEEEGEGEKEEVSIPKSVEGDDDVKEKRVIHEHYLITGRPPVDPTSSSLQRFVIHIHVTNHESCEIHLIESHRQHSQQQQLLLHQEEQKVIQNLVDIILYALGVICDDDAKLITT
jgi:hypothetical protein